MSSKDIATDLWALRVKQLANWRCERCGSPDGVQAHHIFVRNRLATRTDESNGVCLCVQCHVPWAHAFPLAFECWCRERMGDEQYDALQVKSRQIYAGPNFDEEVTRLRVLVKESA